MEEKLGTVGIGYPTLVTIVESKKVISKMNRAFTKDNIEQYLNDVFSNKAKFSKLYELPKFSTIQS